MIIFIINTLLVLSSIAVLIYDYMYIKNSKNNIDSRIKRFIFGGIEVLLFGIALVTLSITGSRNLNVEVKPFILIIMILIAIIVYICLIILWNKMFAYFNKYFSKKSMINQKYKYKSISIYGLVYSFGILFYLIYIVVFF